MATTPHVFSSGELVTADNLDTRTDAILELQAVRPLMCGGSFTVTANSSHTYFSPTSGASSFWTGEMTVSFPAGLFTLPPAVFTLCANSGAPGFSMTTSVYAINSSQCTVVYSRFDNTTPVLMHWYAIQQNAGGSDT